MVTLKVFEWQERIPLRSPYPMVYCNKIIDDGNETRVVIHYSGGETNTKKRSTIQIFRVP